MMWNAVHCSLKKIFKSLGFGFGNKKALVILIRAVSVACLEQMQDSGRRVGSK